MSFAQILLLSVGVAMDATAVAAARGLAVPRVRFKHVVMVALLFGGFQALMPLLGALLGARIGPLVQAWDHWIAFGLLVIVGGKMLLDAKKEDKPSSDPFALKVMLVLAVATSIDAFAVGITLPMMNAPLVLSLTTIGVTTAILSGLGVVVGRRVATGRKLEVVGGLVLIGLGIKILVEHLTAR